MPRGKKKKDTTVTDEAPQETVAATTPDAPTRAEPAEDPRDAVLKNYRSWGVKRAGKQMGVVNDPNEVGNVPADRCVTWATDPRLDAGRHLDFVKNLGFRPVEPDEVSRDPNRAGKYHVSHYEEWNKYVVRGGGVLMIGYRQYRDERRAAAKKERKDMLDASREKLKDAGIEQQRSTRRGSLAEVQR